MINANNSLLENEPRGGRVLDGNSREGVASMELTELNSTFEVSDEIGLDKKKIPDMKNSSSRKVIKIIVLICTILVIVGVCIGIWQVLVPTPSGS